MILALVWNQVLAQVEEGFDFDDDFGKYQLRGCILNKILEDRQFEDYADRREVFKQYSHIDLYLTFAEKWSLIQLEHNLNECISRIGISFTIRFVEVDKEAFPVWEPEIPICEPGVDVKI